MNNHLYQGQKARNSRGMKGAISELLCSLDCSGLFEKLVGHRMANAVARGAAELFDWPKLSSFL